MQSLEQQRSLMVYSDRTSLPVDGGLHSHCSLFWIIVVGLASVHKHKGYHRHCVDNRTQGDPTCSESAPTWTHPSGSNIPT